MCVTLQNVKITFGNGCIYIYNLFCLICWLHSFKDYVMLWLVKHNYVCNEIMTTVTQLMLSGSVTLLYCNLFLDVCD